MDQNFLNLLPEDLKKIANDLYDIILERTLTKAYNNLSEENKVKMAQIFNSGTEQEKINFLKNYLGDWQTLMMEETRKLVEEIKKSA